MVGNRGDDYGDEDVHEDVGADHRVSQEKDDRYRRIRAAANHVRCGALPDRRRQSHNTEHSGQTKNAWAMIENKCVGYGKVALGTHGLSVEFSRSWR